MALTPAEVHNVAFKKPPIGKRGYDEEEVDAFLDLVETELTRLIEENTDLRQRLTGGEGGAATAGAPVDEAALAAEEALQTELASVREENARLQNQVGELERALSGGQDDAQHQVVELQQQITALEQQLSESRAALEQVQQAGAPGGEFAAAPSDHHQQAVQMLALAQQTADQHLAASKAEAERLLSEARSTAETTVSEANALAQATLSDAEQRSTTQLSEAEQRARKLDEDSTARAEQTVSEAEQRAATISAQFDQRRGALERRIEELRVFEREYRSRLKGYLESQLRDLTAAERVEPEDGDTADNDELADAAQS